MRPLRAQQDVCQCGKWRDCGEYAKNIRRTQASCDSRRMRTDVRWPRSRCSARHASPPPASRRRSIAQPLLDAEHGAGRQPDQRASVDSALRHASRDTGAGEREAGTHRRGIDPSPLLLCVRVSSIDSGHQQGAHDRGGREGCQAAPSTSTMSSLPDDAARTRGAPSDRRRETIVQTAVVAAARCASRYPRDPLAASVVVRSIQPGLTRAG